MMPALFTSAALIAAQPAIGQEANGQNGNADDDGLVYYDPLIVTADGFEQQAFDTPYVVDVIGQDEIRDYGIRSVPEALRYTPGVLVQRTGHGQGSPYIRGFTGYRNVFLIDGVRLNNSIFRSGPNQYWNTIDPFSIERLEVIKGPSSGVYGSLSDGNHVASDFRGPGFVNCILQGGSSFPDQ